MTDAAHVDDDQGDGPDLLDDRLTAIARLIDTIATDPDIGRRALGRTIALRLLARLAADAMGRVADLADRLDQV